MQDTMLWRYLTGFLVALFLGAFCRYMKIPSPAPQALYGSLLVVSVTIGYLAVDYWLSR